MFDVMHSSLIALQLRGGKTGLKFLLPFMTMRNQTVNIVGRQVVRAIKNPTPEQLGKSFKNITTALVLSSIMLSLIANMSSWMLRGFREDPEDDEAFATKIARKSLGFAAGNLYFGQYPAYALERLVKRLSGSNVKVYSPDGTPLEAMAQVIKRISDLGLDTPGDLPTFASQTSRFIEVVGRVSGKQWAAPLSQLRTLVEGMAARQTHDTDLLKTQRSSLRREKKKSITLEAPKGRLSGPDESRLRILERWYKKIARLKKTRAVMIKRGQTDAAKELSEQIEKISGHFRDMLAETKKAA